MKPLLILLILLLGLVKNASLLNPKNEVIVHQTRRGEHAGNPDTSGIARTTEDPAATSVTKRTKPLDCSIPSNLNKEWINGKVVRACQSITRDNGEGTEVIGVAIRCIINGFEIDVGSGKKVNRDHWQCVRKGRTEAVLTHALLYHCRNGRKMDTEWIEKSNGLDIVKSCKGFKERGKTILRIVTVACKNERGDRINMGDELDDGAGQRYICSMKGDGATLLVVPYAVQPLKQVCDNGLRAEESKIENGVGIKCHRFDSDKLMAVAWFCMVKELADPIIMIGSTVRENGTEYSCEKRGETGAELVVKSFRQLCEEGDESIDAWIDNEVLRDCVQSGKKNLVYARLCILSDERIIEIGQNITEEFETYICKRKGEFDAELIHDHSRIHPTYFTVPGTCKNGKKTGEKWTENGVIHRACRTRSGRSTVQDLGCKLDDGRVIAVGKEETWTVPASPGQKAITKKLTCTEGKPGFPAEAIIKEIEEPSEEKVVRYCDNGKRENEEWLYKNVLRHCIEVEDAMTIVAIQCVFGNDTLEVGKMRREGDYFMIECMRVGNHDATVKIDLVMPDLEPHKRSSRKTSCPRPRKRVACENGREVDEKWNDGSARMVCRVRKGRPSSVRIGCVLSDGTVLAFGESHTVHISGLEVQSRCHIGDDGEVEISDGSAKVGVRHDDKNPCGEKKFGEIWADGPFLKKCKVIDGNMLTAATIGCVTVKGTHMLEGQYLVEDDYDLKCARNDEGKLQLHYSFTVIEE